MVNNGLLRQNEVIFYHPLNNLSELTQDQAWIGHGLFVSGLLPSSSPVGISALKASDFTVGVPSSLTTFVNNMEHPPVLASINDSQAIVFYRDTLEGLQARVVSVSGTDITLGSSVVVGVGHYSSIYSIATMPSGKFVVTNRFINNGNSSSWVLSASGDVVSVGSPVVHFPHDADGQNDNGGTIVSLDDTKVLVVWAFHKVGATTVQARIGTVDGMSLTYGAEQDIETVSVSDESEIVVTKLSSTKAAIAWIRDDGGGPELATMILTISGDTITGTSGTVYVIESLTQTQMGICTIDDNRFSVSYDSSGDAKVIVGQVSGTVITYGSPIILDNIPGINKITNTSCYKLDTNIIYTVGRIDNFGSISIETFDVNGIVLSKRGRAICADSTFGGGQSPRIAATTLNPDKIILGTFDDVNDAYIKSGELQTGASITASSGDVYPSMSGHTRVVTAFWSDNPTINTTVINIGRGYQIGLTSSSVSLGSGVWNISLGLDDGNNHLTVLDFSHVTGTTWRLKTSIDGSGFVDQGTQTSGDEAISTVDTVPILSLTDAFLGDQWIDELILWGGDKTTFKQFTDTELQNLFDLVTIAGDPMDQYDAFIDFLSAIPGFSIILVPDTWAENIKAPAKTVVMSKTITLSPETSGISVTGIVDLFNKTIPFDCEIVSVRTIMGDIVNANFNGTGGSVAITIESSNKPDISPRAPFNEVSMPSPFWETLVSSVQCRDIPLDGLCFDAPSDGINVMVQKHVDLRKFSSIRAVVTARVEDSYPEGSGITPVSVTVITELRPVNLRDRRFL